MQLPGFAVPLEADKRESGGYESGHSLDLVCQQQDVFTSWVGLLCEPDRSSSVSGEESTDLRSCGETFPKMFLKRVCDRDGLAFNVLYCRVWRSGRCAAGGHVGSGT